MSDGIRVGRSSARRASLAPWLVEIIAVVGTLACSALVLTRGVSLADPWLSAVLSQLCVAILPGYLLTAILFPHDEWDGLTRVALFGSLSLSLFLLLGTILLFARATLQELGQALLVLQVALFALFVLTRARSWRSRSAFTVNHLPFDAVTVSYLALFLLLSIFAILFWANKAPLWRYGDTWFYVPVIRDLLQSPHLQIADVYIGQNPVGARLLFSGWWVWQAFLSRLSHSAPVDTFLIYTRPLLMAISLLGYYGLARELTRSTRTALLVASVQIVFFLSDIAGTDALGRGAIGYQFFGRLTEDKAVVAFVLVPVASLLFLRFMADGRLKTILAFALLAAGSAVIHPLGMVYVGLSCGLFLVVRFFFHRDREFITRAALILLIVGLLFSVPMAQYFIRRSMLGGETNSLETVLNETRERVQSNKLQIVSDAHDLYVLDPQLLDSPYTILSILLCLVLLLRIKRDVVAQFLSSNVLVVLLILYNPLTASVLGRIITPILLWRIVWILPIGLAIGYALWIVTPHLEKGLERMLAGLPFSRANTTSGTRRPFWSNRLLGGMLVPWIATIGLLLLQLGHILDGGSVLDTMKTASVTPQERRFLEQADAFIDRGSHVLASPAMNDLVPAFTDGYVFYFKEYEPFFPESVQDIETLFSLQRTDEERIALVTKYSAARYLIAAQESEPTLVSLADQMPLVFIPVFENEGYILYEILPDRTTEAGQELVWGSYYYRLGDDEQAMESFLHATDKGSQASGLDLALAYVGLGNVRLHLGLLEDALGAYDEAIRLAPGPSATGEDLDQAYIGQANAYWRLGEFEQALDSLAQVTEDAPHITLARALRLQVLGNQYDQAGNLEQAVGSYWEAAGLYNALNRALGEDDPLPCAGPDLLSREPSLPDEQAGVRMLFADKLWRVVLYQHPPSRLSYRLEVPSTSALKFGIGLSEEVWQLGKGDGVRFDIEVDDGQVRSRLFSEYVDPKNVVADRRWYDYEIDLSDWGGQTVTLTLSTDPGPHGNYLYDWAGWSDLCLGQPSAPGVSESTEP